MMRFLGLNKINRKGRTMRQEMQRFGVSNQAGQQGKKQFAVVDRQDKQGGKGMRRVSFHRSFREAQRRAQAMNKAD